MQLATDYDSAKQLALNGINVFIFGNKNKSVIIYVDGNIDYNIDLQDYDFDSAIKIAETIK